MSRLNMDFDSGEDMRIESLKKEYGKQTTELVRFIIAHQYRGVNSKDGSIIK